MEVPPVAVVEDEERKRTRPKPLPKALPKLRDLPHSSCHFWKKQLNEYVAQQVRDRTYDGTNDRYLPPNEIDALALNEIAVSEGQGFFLFLPNRNSWNHQTYEPKSRGPRPQDLRSTVPSLVFMRYTWSKKGQENFLHSPHRLRYMACNFQINPPSAATPLYCIQVASGSRYQLYSTPHTSFIVLRSNPLYFGSVDEMEGIIGRPKRPPKGPDPSQRLGQVYGLWDKQPIDARLEPYSYKSLKGLYDVIINTCHPSASASSMTSAELWKLLPRPSSPEMGMTLGRGTMPIRSRVGGRLRRYPYTGTITETPSAS
ncbi:Nn.00g007440.m01.CDS01 [Neocucurbitaria sp. VM-36]